MPRCEVWWLQGRSVEQKNEIAKKLTKSFTEVLNCPDDEVVVIFRETSPDVYYRGGISAAQKAAEKKINQRKLEPSERIQTAG